MSEAPRGRRARPIRSRLRRHGLARRPEPIRSLTRVHELHFTAGNGVRLFDEGRMGLGSMLDAIRDARHRIHLETYILRTDATGRRFLDALTDRAREGVDVRVIFDAVGSRGVDPAPIERLRAAGGEVLVFNPLSRLYPRFAPRRRDHRKILVVDGKVAFTGGLNIGDEYDTEEWHDAHVQIEGPAVRELDAVFLESWYRADGPDLRWHELLQEEPAPAGDVRCAVLPDGPVYRRRRVLSLLQSALDSATRTARFESPYFTPGRRLYEHLAGASARGVAVELVLAGKTDHPLLRRATRALLPRLVRRGVRVWEYESYMMHGKVAVFDREWAIVGTSNLDRQSFEHSYEVNLVIEGGDIPKHLDARFRRDVSRSRAVDAAALAARTPLERFVDRLASLLLFVV